MAGSDSNHDGNWTGRDPRLRLLRTVAGFVLLALIAYLVIDPAPNDPTTIGLLFGGLLVDMGFEINEWTRRGGGDD